MLSAEIPYLVEEYGVLTKGKHILCEDGIRRTVYLIPTSRPGLTVEGAVYVDDHKICGHVVARDTEILFFVDHDGEFAHLIQKEI